MGRAALDLSGARFGSLVAIERVGTQITPKAALWRCVCGCGREYVLGADRLRFWKGAHCEPCAPPPPPRQIDDPAYTCWRAMIARCEDRKANGYDRYGGRGIVVCSRWRYSFP